MATLFGEKLDGAKCVLCGFGRANSGGMRYLMSHGADIAVCDKGMSKREVEKRINELGVKAEAVDYSQTPRCDYVFRTPGMRADCEKLKAFADMGAVITDETRLFLENARAKVIGITGSDGKTTTSSITAEILKNAFSGSERRVFLCGNIGTPMSDFIDIANENDIIVLELSSFQLMYSELSPQISAVTNLTENHLDWHTDLNEYFSAKRRIFEGKGAEKLVIDTETAKKIRLNYDKCPKKVVFTNEKGGFFCHNGLIFNSEHCVLERAELLLRGEHNLKNFLTAAALTDGIADDAAFRKTAREFKGVKHRMSLVARHRNVNFYDSSIDSTPSRAVATLRCFSGALTVIVGGHDKNLDYVILAQYLSRNAKNVVITGACGEKIFAETAKIPNFGAKIYRETDFERAVERAVMCGIADGEAFEESNVVLSPACASFDAFENYEARGDRFSELVNNIVKKCLK